VDGKRVEVRDLGDGAVAFDLRAGGAAEIVAP
jgi:hypothetical protein